VPATVEFADIAGGGGAKTGAQALLDVAPFRNADALLHVVRMFRDPSIPHPAGSVDPARDVRAMEDEVILADLGVVERRLERLERDLKKTNTPELRKEQEILVRCREALEGGRALRALELGAEDSKRLRGFQFLSAKPLLIVLNLDESDLPNAADAARLAGIEDFLTGAATRAVPICAKIELEIAQLDEADRVAFMADLGLTESGLDRVIRASYDLLGYISFFTVGEGNPRAVTGIRRMRSSWATSWTRASRPCRPCGRPPSGRRSALASIASWGPSSPGAGEIHSDISRGFIRAEVVRYEHLLARSTLAACRDHGELRLEGKEYIVLDGDVINFRHAT
jgi:ribosome-binding ATPase YchF (GTP1/OBG family)